MNTLIFLNKNNTKDLNNIRSLVYKNHIKTFITDEINKSNNYDSIHRIIFTSNRYKSNFTSQLSFECNGLITESCKKNDLYSHKILYYPTQNFCMSRLKRSNIVENFNQNLYEIHKVYDGTNIGLYYYNDKWTISTVNGYDVNDLIFTNNKTYKEILDEILQDYPHFSYNNLDQNKCYSLIMKYNDFHPFQNNNYVILLQSVDLIELNIENKLKISFNDDIGLPCQSFEYKNLSINELYKLNENSYKNYLKIGINNNSFNPHLGFILRSKNFNKTKEYSNIFSESVLMSYIRNMIYNKVNKINVNIIETRLTPSIKINNVINFNKLKMILNISNIARFKNLFPHFDNQITEINAFLYTYLTTYLSINKDIFLKNINYIHQILNNHVKLQTKNIELRININKKLYEQKDELNKLCIILISDINNTRESHNILSDKTLMNCYLRDEKFIYLFYNYIYNTCKY